VLPGGLARPQTNTLATGDEFAMNCVPFRALLLANFGEFLFHALR
jgi:hypothetical protein